MSNAYPVRTYTILLYDRVKVKVAGERYAKGIVIGLERRAVQVAFDHPEKGAFVPLRDFLPLALSVHFVEMRKVEREDQ